MKKLLFFMVFSSSLLFSVIDLQTASKSELMCIKGIGEKKANAIIEYRKKNKIKSVDDLINIKGFGKGLIAKVKKGEQSTKCKNKKKQSQKGSSTTNNNKGTKKEVKTLKTSDNGNKNNSTSSNPKKEPIKPKK